MVYEPNIKQLLEDLKKVTKYDVVFKCVDGEVTAHSLLLEVRSEVFHAMFNGEFEKETNIDMTEYSVDMIKDFREFIYTATYPDTTKYSIEDMYSMYNLADKYMLDGLKNSMNVVLMDIACDYEGAFVILEFAHKNMKGIDLGDAITEEALDTIYGVMSNYRSAQFPDIDLQDYPHDIIVKIFHYIVKKRLEVAKKFAEEEKK